MAFDPSSFASELGMSAEDKAALDALFGKYPTAVTKLESVLASEVETRLNPLKTELEAKQKDLDAQFETLASIRGNDQGAIDAAEKRAEKLASEVAVLTARMRRVGSETGVDVEPYLKDLAEAPPAKKEPVANLEFDPNAIIAQANRIGLTSLRASAELRNLEREHEKLFPNEPFDGLKLLEDLQERVKRTGNQNIGFREVWESKYNVPAKRAEQTEAEVQRRIAEAVQKKEIELNDAAALRGTTGQEPAPAFVGSPAFSALTKDQKPRTINGVPDIVASAIADYHKGQQDRARAS
jgi:hypothetical protein